MHGSTTRVLFTEENTDILMENFDLYMCNQVK